MAATKWVFATIGDKITAGILLDVGVGAVDYLLNLDRKGNKAKK